MSKIIGPPPAKSTKGKYLPIFILVGIFIFFLIISFGDTIDNWGHQLYNLSGSAFTQAASCSVLALLVGSVQAWVFRDHLGLSRRFPFILAAIIGGVVGGAIGGVTIDATKITTATLNGLLIGLLIGLSAGMISSLIQNSFMSTRGQSNKSIKKKNQNLWIIYSLLSWAIVWGVGWAISWSFTTRTMGIAIAACFMMVASGIALNFFLNKSTIEF
jgi:F0F1-type ATP synthase assembly protein I